MSNTKKYEKLTQREHVLVRPDTYMGSIESTQEELWVFDDDKIVKKNITFTPAFLKIFDEILVNASDHAQNDKTCDTIKVEYNKEEGFISIWNNGDNGIPVEEHPDHKMMIPSMIFGELLTGSNFDDTEKRTTGGRNGLGSKITNIFSTKFIIEIVDSKKNKKFIQEWTNNMLNVNKAQVTKSALKNSYIKVTFYPDFKRFGINDLNNDHYNLFNRRTYDIAALNNLKVFFNNKKIDTTNFKLYMQLHFSKDDIIYLDDSNERWTVGVLYKPDAGGEIISFVNSINTYHGGSHVNHVVDNIIKILINDYIKKKDKEIKISPQLLKENLVFFVNSILENPTFSSQSKDTCTSKVDKFGSKYEPQQAFLKKLAKCGIVEQVIELAKFKENSSLKKTDGKKLIRIKGIPKLDDANKAGTKESIKCSLILTEGDSAKAFAMAGLAVTGRDYFGVFPLKGILLNVRDAQPTQLMNNDEINNLKQIIGLKHNEDYSNDAAFETLRYGRIIALVDSDVDGSHIKGLLMNFVHSLWPSLIKRTNFITSLATPIVKAFKGKEILTFYNLTHYNDWIETKPIGAWKTKYYKGLGTSTSAEAREYFVDVEDKLIKYLWNATKEKINTDIENLDGDNAEDNDDKPYDKANDEDAILLAFDKTRADDRKVWLQNYDKNDVLLYEDKNISYSRFVHSELIHFSNDDLSRSIPSLIDGLKPSQRKIVYGAFLRGLDKDEVKVAQLAGFVSDRAAYHHGEASLTGAIIGMAQDYVGSNNINILKPNGQFGCLSPETPVLMWDGSCKRADEIKVDDILVGDDGTERIVLELTNGIDDMFEIVSDHGLKFNCNSQHILTLHFKNNNVIMWDFKNSRWFFKYFDGKDIITVSIEANKYDVNTTSHTLEKLDILREKRNEIMQTINYGEFIDIELIDYISLPTEDQKELLLVSNNTNINWCKVDVEENPYNIGKKIYDSNCRLFNICCSSYIIPENYIINDMSVRLQLLAGLIDHNPTSKLYISDNNSNESFIRISYSIDILKQINFVCKSLGFITNIMGDNEYLYIYGNHLHIIPCKYSKKLMKTKYETLISFSNFSFRYLRKGRFYGFQIDKNERFLLGNFIVTHNSRLKNGADAASPRYIWTKLEELSTIIFNQNDTPVLPNQVEDNQPIEPEYYAPIIPMILINGTQGIGTGFSTKIPPYDPKDVIKNLKLKINNKPMEPMDPYWHGFEGIVAKHDEFNYEIYGTWVIKGSKMIITELPIGESTYSYKEFLEKLLESDDTKKTVVAVAKTVKGKAAKPKAPVKQKKELNPLLSYTENNTDTKIYFELNFEDGYLESAKDIDKTYRLVKKYSLTNMNLFDKNGVITKFDSVLDIINIYYETRLDIYHKRKQYQLDILEFQLKIISFKVKFILMIVNKELIINNKKKSELEDDLVKHKFPKMGKNKNDDDKNYSYLLTMPIHNLTFEKIEELKKQELEKQTEFDELSKLTSSNIWLSELNKLEKEYDNWINHKQKESEKDINKSNKLKKKNK